MRKSFVINLIISILLLIVFMVFVSTIGAVKIPFSDSIKILVSKIPLINKFVDVSNIKHSHLQIILNIRFPRIVLSALIGGSLAASGSVFQGVFKNPMADPYVLGVSSGAALGASIVIIFFNTVSYLGISTVVVGAFIGAVLSILIVYNLSRIGGKTPTVTLLLAGIAINFFLSSIISLLMALNRDQVERIIFWTMGSVSAASWSKIYIILIPFIIVNILFIFFAKDLNLLLLGEDSAQSLGVDVEKTKIVLLVLSSLSTAAAVSVSGIIGFVGLIVPHAVRIISGPDHRRLIPFAIVGGSIFMVISDTISRTIVAPTEIPIGVVTAMFGAPYFLYLLVKNKNMGGIN
ncbi:FecCD family ABC transporter permease [Helicovermis profundi]|uniref:Iron ABC transporter permease n=1 Tax=Helicovermis profundi TaxID=3065157 RepID=A0AAU9DZT0_9FIRM|nr:iron ABC transporter permease [Clostridia bacterium S502]